MKYAAFAFLILLAGASSAESYTAVLNGPSRAADQGFDNPSLWGAVPGASDLNPTDVLSRFQLRVVPRLTAKTAKGGSTRQRCTDERMHSLLNSYSERLGVDHNLVYAMIYQESKCNPSAVSHAGARGLMQLMPSHGAAEAYEWLTGRQIKSYDLASLHDPETNILLGVAYTRMQLDTFSKYPPEARIRLALAAYNWGPSRVLKRMPKLTSDVDEKTRAWSAKVPPAETRGYIARILYYKSYLDSLDAKRVASR